MSIQLESAVKLAIAEIRGRLREQESISHFTFRIEAEGRLDGDVVLSFSLGEYGPEVRGSALDPVMQEFLRRYGWNAHNVPLCLPNAGVTDDE